jgi:hypothetical protein
VVLPDAAGPVLTGKLVVEVDPSVCPKCGAQMKVVAVIEDLDELGRVLRHPGCRAEQQP